MGGRGGVPALPPEGLLGALGVPDSDLGEPPGPGRVPPPAPPEPKLRTRDRSEPDRCSRPMERRDSRPIMWASPRDPSAWVPAPSSGFTLSNAVGEARELPSPNALPCCSCWLRWAATRAALSDPIPVPLGSRVDARCLRLRATHAAAATTAITTDPAAMPPTMPAVGAVESGGPPTGVGCTAAPGSPTNRNTKAPRPSADRRLEVAGNRAARPTTPGKP